MINFLEKLPQYQSYKKSEIESTELIPEGWSVKSIRYSFKFLNSQRIPLSAPQREVRKGDYPYYGASGIIDYVDGYIFDEPLILIAEDGANLLSKSTPLAFVAKGKYWVNNHAHIIKPNLPGFTYWAELLSSLDYTASISGAAQPKLTRDRLGSIKIPIPPTNEIPQIASFLDAKTSLISRAISVKERQIELLKERKQILIQQAVVRGIDPHAPMRDSGIEWIGEIPAHWKLRRLKYVLEECSERSRYGEEPLFMMSQVHGLVVRSEFHEKAEVAASAVGNKIVHEGDLVFNKLKAHLGVFFKSCIPFQGIVSPDYAVYRSKAYFKDLKYLEHLFRHPAYIGQFIVRATGVAEGLIRLYTTELFDIPVPVAPDDEQQEILCYIDKVSEMQDKALSLLKQQITKLKEYKATLIYSAVTGKIKVPGVVEADTQHRELA